MDRVAQFSREVRVDGGGAHAAVAEIFLNELKCHAGFEEVGGIAVAQCVDVSPLVDAGLPDRASERPSTCW
jgi:hypothetical protein